MIRLPIAACSGDFEHVAVDFLLELFDDGPAAAVGVAAVADDREGVDAVALDQDIQPHQFARPVAEQFVVHRAVAARGALELVVHVVDHFGQRQVVRQHRPRRREIFGAHVRRRGGRCRAS